MTYITYINTCYTHSVTFSFKHDTFVNMMNLWWIYKQIIHRHLIYILWWTMLSVWSCLLSILVSLFDLLYHLSVLFRLIVTFGTLHYPSIWYKMYIMAVPSGAGTTYRFAVPELIPGFKWVSCWSICRLLCSTL
jgi:hypothetical protein